MAQKHGQMTQPALSARCRRVARAIYQCRKAIGEGRPLMTAAEPSLREHSPAPRPAPVHDPVCGMAVDPRTAHRAEHAGAGYFFCSARCRDRFVAEPARYLADPGGHTPDVAVPEAGGARWTCPMHPPIVR